jgi:enamine deaminase RidA (YjgF/YER057c/UK114 family)
MTLRHLNPPGLPDWSQTFSQVVVVEHPDFRQVLVSGQVGVDPQKRLAGDGRLEAQLDGAFKNLELALAAARASLLDVVKLTIFIVDYQPEHGALISRAISSRFRAGHFPALSLLGIQALADPQWLVEVEATAVLQTGNAPG